MRVPGVPPTMAGIDFPFSWMCEVREKYGAKHAYGYWVTGGSGCDTRDKVAYHLKIYYPHVEVLSIRRQKQPPGVRMIPVPPTHFQYGIRYKNPMDQFSDPSLTGGENYGNILVPEPRRIEPIRVAKIEPLGVKPISLRPLAGLGVGYGNR